MSLTMSKQYFPDPQLSYKTMNVPGENIEEYGHMNTLVYDIWGGVVVTTHFDEKEREILIGRL